MYFYYRLSGIFRFNLTYSIIEYLYVAFLTDNYRWNDESRSINVSVMIVGRQIGFYVGFDR